jgi:hypothetical protein
MSTAILVLLYGCKPCEAKTLQTLFVSSLNLDHVHLYVWNNGPTLWNDSDLAYISNSKIKFTTIQSIENKPLSWIYNDFIAMAKAQRYVFLDHDSNLNDGFISDILSTNDYDIGVPTISSKNANRSPTVNGIFKLGPYSKQDVVIAIGSGITASHTVIEKLQQRYGDVFDSSFAFYGVDTSFFLRVYQCGLADRIVNLGGFEHSLSRLEVESVEKQKFRMKERSIDQGLMLRYYSGRYHVLRLIKFLIETKLCKGRFYLSNLLKAYMTGKHPKCLAK